jgi:hypothetical protein
MSIPAVKVPFMLGNQQRTVVMNFNAWCEVERATGINPFGGEQFDLSSPNNVRIMLWAGLRHEDPTLTLEQVGDMLDAHEGGFTAALVAVSQALEASLPRDLEVVENDDEGAEGNPTGGR